MAKSVEISAKTIDEAIEDGLAQLGASYDGVEVEVISNGGMFKKAKVKLTLKKGVEVVKPKTESKVEEVKEEKTKEKVAEKKVEVKKEEKREVKKAPVKEGNVKVDACVDFVNGLMKGLGNSATVNCEDQEKCYMININGDDVGRLIGKGGEALNALQTLVSSVAIAHANGDNKRVFVNIENYKEKREETLILLAKKKAAYVKESGRYVKLEPMVARDRAIIHTALQDIEGVRSYSTGDGHNRRLVIAPEKKGETQND